MGSSLYHNYPNAIRNLNHPDWLIWWFSNLSIAGTMRGLLSILFGAGVVLLLSRGMNARHYYHRNICLILFGIMHGTFLLWANDILFTYGVAALFLYPLRKFSTRLLLTTAIVSIFGILGIGTAYHDYAKSKLIEETRQLQTMVKQGRNLDSSQQETLEKGASITSNIGPSKDKIAHEFAVRQSGYMANLFLSSNQFLNRKFSRSSAITRLLECVSTMILGMALFKMGFLQGKLSVRIYLFLTVGCYLIALPLRGFVLWLEYISGPNEFIWQQSAIFVVTRIPITLGHIGLFNLLLGTKRLSGIFSALADVGKMALTNYIGQSVMSAVIFLGFGWGLYGLLTWTQIMMIAALILVIQTAFSMYWLKLFRFGPIEWIWRSITHWHIQAMRLRSPQ